MSEISEMTIAEVNAFLTDKLTDMVDEAHQDLLKLANVVTSATSMETSNVGGVNSSENLLNEYDTNTKRAEQWTRKIASLIKNGENLVQKMMQKGRGALPETEKLKSDLAEAKLRSQLWKRHAIWAKQQFNKWNKAWKEAKSYAKGLSNKIKEYGKNKSALEGNLQKAENFLKRGKGILQKMKGMKQGDAVKIKGILKEWNSFHKNADNFLKKAQAYSRKIKEDWKKDKSYIQRVQAWVNSIKQEAQQDEAENKSKKIDEEEEEDQRWTKEYEEDERRAQNRLKEP